MVFASILLLVGVAFFSFYRLVYASNPIEIEGYSWNTMTEGKTVIVLQFHNKGRKDITLKDITFNQGKKPKELALGISYSGQLVQPATGDPRMDDPRTKFMNIDAAPIHPRLSPNEINEAIKRKDNTPIYYGIKVEFYQEPIKSMTIKYTYFGVLVTKKINLEFWEIKNQRIH